MIKKMLLKFLPKIFTFLLCFSLFLSSFGNQSPIFAFINIYDLAETTNWNIRIDGVAISDKFSQSIITTADLDNDGKEDLLIGAPLTDNNSRSASGSVYIIYNSLFINLTGQGNTIDLADPSNYNLRIDGAGGGGGFQQSGFRVADLDGDNKLDILTGSPYLSNNSRSNSGSLYIIYNTLIDDYTGTGNNLDLANPLNYNLRFDGALANDSLTTGFSFFSNDYNNDNKNDIWMGSRASNNSRNFSGSLYLISNSIFDDYTGTGNNIDLANSNNYSLRFDGAIAMDLIATTVLGDDIDGDSLPDILINAIWTDYNSRSTSGSLYIIYNTLIDDYIGTGNNIDLAIESNYNLRFDGSAASAVLGQKSIEVVDLNNNTKKDLLLSQEDTLGNLRADSGSIFVIYDTLIDDYTGTGNNIDLAIDSNYNLRFDGANVGDLLGYGGTSGSDFDNNGLSDLEIAAYWTDYNSRNKSSSLYVIYDSLLSQYAGTGNSIDLANPANYSLRYDGPSSVQQDNMSGKYIAFSDLNNDSSKDVIMGIWGADFNSRTDSGSLYIIYNFPHTISLDSVVIPTTDTTPTLTGSIIATDSVTKIAMMQYSIDDNSFSGDWQGCTPDDGTFDSKEEDYTCNVSTLTDGEHTVYIRSYDENILYTAQASYGSTTFIVDTTGPTGTISINSDATITNTSEVELTLSSTDNLTEVKKMMICNNETFTDCSWENYDTSKNWTLIDGEGTKTVYAKFKDEGDNESETVSQSIILDLTGPTGTISINSDEEITNTDEVTLTLSATDNLSGISKMMVSNKVDYSGGTWETYNTSKEWRLSMGDGEKRVYVKYRDEVGNISSSYSDSIEMDMGAPTGTLIINEGEEYTSSREVVLHITGEDEVTGVEEMRISEDRTMEGVEWEGYETSREYTLSEGDGYKVIYIQYRDGVENESEVYGSNITLDSNTEIEVTEIGEEEVEGEIVSWETEETTPTFTGEGEVGATITIEIEGIETGTVIVNEDGVWSWTPSIELTRGQEYNVTITSTDLAGNEDTQTFTLGIADEEVIEVNQTTPEAQTTTTQLPNTGVVLIISLMLLGGLIWSGYNLKVIEKLKKAHRR